MRHRLSKGMRMLWAAVAVAIIALASPTSAFAAAKPGDVIVVKNGSNLSKKTYGHDIRFHTAPDGSVMYCIEMMVSGGDSSLETKVSNDRITGHVGYVLYHGYPNTRKIGGREWTATEARFITQCAVWVFTDVGGNTNSTFYTTINQPYRDAVGALVREAKSWASTSKNAAWAPENNYALKCNPTDRSKQKMLLVTGILEGTPDLRKSSGNPTLTSGNPDYSLSGATYLVYKEDGKTSTGKYFLVNSNGNGVLRVWKNGTSPNAKDATASLPAGSYRVKEYRAPKGYALDTKTYTLNVVGLQKSSLSVTDTPLEPGSLSLLKSSASPDVTEQNACYSLEGAEYGVYSDEACTRSVGTLKTGKDGASNQLTVFEGSYWVKETKPSHGYLLDDVAHKVSVTKNKTSVLSCKEVPATDGVSAIVQKRDADLKEATAQGSASLAGAQFTVAFYAGDYTQETLPETPTRSWVIGTDNKGAATLDEEHKVSGDELYLSADGKPCLPLGTIAIAETKAPEGYLITDDAHEVRRIVYNSEQRGIETHLAPLEVDEHVARGGIRLRKADSTGQGLSGARFAITNNSKSRVVVDGKAHAPGEVCLTITSDEQGMATTGADSLPYGSYTVTEAQPPAGYLPNENWSKEVSIGSDGEVVDLTEDPCIDEPVTTEVVLSATKLFDGESQNLELQEGMFSFELADDRGTVLQTKCNDAEGNVTFDPIVFNYAQVGSHSYTIREVRGGNELIVYDDHVERVTVSVAATEDGSIAARVNGDEDGAVFRNKTVDALPMPLTGGEGLGAPLECSGALASAASVVARRRRHGSPQV